MNARLQPTRLARRTALAAFVTLAASIAFAASAAPAEAQKPRGEKDPLPGDTARVVDRLDLRSADEVLVTREGDIALLIHGPELVIQLTDAGLDGLDRPDRADEEGEDDDGLGARLLRAMLGAGVRTLLDNGIAYPIADVTRAEYAGGRLHLESQNGEIFDITLNDRDVMDDFDESEARSFARALRARMTSAGR